MEYQEVWQRAYNACIVMGASEEEAEYHANHTAETMGEDST